VKYSKDVSSLCITVKFSAVCVLQYRFQQSVKYSKVVSSLFITVKLSAVCEVQ